jgi:hypothetical protein
MSDTVWVASKVPNGLVIGGVALRGAAVARQQARQELMAKQRPSRFTCPGGYSLTEVPAHVWRAWIAANAESDLVRNNIVFGGEDRGAVASKAASLASVSSGLEVGTANGVTFGDHRAGHLA